MSSVRRSGPSTISRRCGRPAGRTKSGRSDPGFSMRLVICAVGRLKAGPERDLVARYAERLNASARSLAHGPLDIVEIDESRARRPEDRKAEEANKLLAAAGSALIVALDENGTSPGSEAFAA